MTTRPRITPKLDPAVVLSALDRDPNVVTPIMAKILRWYYGDKLYLRQIGEKYNLSVERIRGLRDEALLLLGLKEEPPKPPEDPTSLPVLLDKAYRRLSSVDQRLARQGSVDEVKRRVHEVLKYRLEGEEVSWYLVDVLARAWFRETRRTAKAQRDIKSLQAKVENVDARLRKEVEKIEKRAAERVAIVEAKYIDLIKQFERYKEEHGPPLIDENGEFV